MSFGLRNAPSTFQRFITEVLYGLDFVFPYLDDVLVASSTEEEHSEHPKMVFERFQQYGLRINVSKSVMGAAQVEYLGFLITAEDASDFAVGAVLQQLENERWKPIAFYSKKLNETQTRYSTYDRELLGIYLSVKHFKHLLEGNDFIIYTDHKPLTFAFKQKNEKASPRQQRQLQYISEFSCNIQHVLGKDNVVADALSRINSISEINFEEIAEEQTTDEELQKLLHNNSLKFKPSTLPSGKKLWCDISTQKIRPYIPQKFRFQIFQLIHGLAHPGIKSTVKLMIEKYVWSDIKKQVREWAKACIRCQKCKVSRHTKSKLGEFEQPDERFSVVHIDLIGKLPPSEGMQYCLTCIDRFSCWMEAIPIPEITAEIVGRAFYEKWICRFGVPAKIVTDQGRQFEAELFRSIAAICGAKVAHTTSYHPQCNGKVERLHRTLKGAIKAHNNIRWTESLPTVLLGLRAAIRPDISYTIAQMVYDRLKPAYLLAVDNQNEQTSVGQKNEISNWKELSPMPDEQSTTSCGRKIKKPRTEEAIRALGYHLGGKSFHDDEIKDKVEMWFRKQAATFYDYFPTYLSNSGNPTRECPEKRLQRLENEHLQCSIQASIISKEEFEKKKSFTSFPELVECLNAEKLQDTWTIICKNDLVIIMMLDTKISPVIKASVIINKDLDLTIHIGQTRIDQLGKPISRNRGRSECPLFRGGCVQSAIAHVLLDIFG
ncbi:transposon Tf2-8 polyprotein [Trichonephila clavipes]|uniref:RNA-directed DNA polymerase n=1 Tax=Trichonephila clavipes TaxID=2585209 RepID=A0A8X6VMT8_TRICX|nr:transposon Tf2-8 polyprotein [Trichonephila clavipes]